MDVLPTLGVLLRVSVARLSLSLAAERAVRAVEGSTRRFPLAHDVVKTTGLRGLGSLLGCLGLGLALLSVACGMALGRAGSAAISDKTRGGGGGGPPLLRTGVTGLAVLSGCGAGGAVLGSTLVMLLTLGPRGLFVMGVALGLTLLPARARRNAALSAASEMLSFLSVAFITVLVGVCVGTTMAGYRIIDPGKAIIPSLFFTAVFLIPAAFVLAVLAELAFGKPYAVEAQLWLGFGVSVAATGFLVGLGIGYQHTAADALPYDTFSAIRCAVYNAEIVAGVAGSLLGALWVRSRDAVAAGGGPSLWISVPAAAGLYVVRGPASSASAWHLGTGGEVGLMLGLAGASGVALGSAVASSTGKPRSPWQFALLVFGVECGDFYKDSLSFGDLAVSVALTLAPVLAAPADRNTGGEQDGDGAVLSADVPQKSAALGLVMLGATVLGAAGLLTAGLGSAGFYGVMLAALMIILKTINICGKR